MVGTLAGRLVAGGVADDDAAARVVERERLRLEARIFLLEPLGLVLAQLEQD